MRESSGKSLMYHLAPRTILLSPSNDIFTPRLHRYLKIITSITEQEHVSRLNGKSSYNLTISGDVLVQQ